MIKKLKGCRTCSGNRLVRGVTGLTKVALHIDRPYETTIDQRRNICKGCINSSKNSNGAFTRLSQCKLCACLISAKIRIKSEKCPDEKW